MDQRISFIPLTVVDLQASRDFYVDSLGWVLVHDEPGEVLMIQTGEQPVLASALCGSRDRRTVGA